MQESSMKRKTAGSGPAMGRVALVLMGLGFGLQGCFREDALGPQPQTLSVAARGSTARLTDIRNLGELRAMSLTGNYRLVANITMGSMDAPFQPIGSVFNPFRGSFNGNGFTITNLRIDGTDGFYIGLFSTTDGAILDKVRLANVNVKGASMTGGIVGYMINSLLQNSSVTGTVAGSPLASDYGHAHGLGVGYAASRSEIYRCYATGTVTGSTVSAGGFIGEIYGDGLRNGPSDEPRVQVKEIYTRVNVNPIRPNGVSEVAAGGLVGTAQGALIQDINSWSTVTGWGPAGGVIGSLVTVDDGLTWPSTIHQMVSMGKVTSNTYPDRAGVIGAITGDRLSGSRCGSVYNDSIDTGTPVSLSDQSCNVRMKQAGMKAANPNLRPDQLNTTKNLKPYIIGDFIDAAFRRLHPEFGACKLGSGSDGDWYFGSCPGDPVIWNANSPSQYNTLARIPNPSVQPLQ